MKSAAAIIEPDLTDSVTAARALLGWKLIHETPEGRTSGFIVETEAYTADDMASHSYNGKTTRNSAMFGPAGTIYVYFTYGMHYCVNIVTGQKDVGEAVLLRALEPLEGITLMKQRRHQSDPHVAANGPAKLAQAMAIGRAQNGLVLNTGSIHLEPGIVPTEIAQTTRVGITKDIDRAWRFYIKGNNFISRP